ncbi:hypothetical protein SETIT_4G138900v2 [Setaria italica]|uniref:Uncharacterized protein n=1 Tax=Setaria italica TaxID=4555 RepID=A0A368QUG8_SETIT|nr:hypothetical protein SETIT_4G138900v2 [Setaria italica]RCV21427.1 hypothetical protein SETIT_4G138900v2 [Setaria italica]RCV21428.1 hypothetical protein SETIT_4G138900v2 [Setaria italica]
MVRLHLAMAGHGCSQGNARQRQDLSPSAERAHVASSKDKMPVRHHERIMFPLNPQARPACASFPDGHIPDPITQPHLYQNVLPFVSRMHPIIASCTLTYKDITMMDTHKLSSSPSYKSSPT